MAKNFLKWQRRNREKRMPRNNCRVAGFCLLLLLFVGITGCSHDMRMQLLSIFFTGVPGIDAPSEEETASLKAAVEADFKKKNPSKAELARRAAMEPFRGPYVHGPYAAGSCEQCHELAAGGFSFGNKADPTKKNIVPGKFKRPPYEICVECHTSKGNAAVQAAGLRLHGPAWLCTTCHLPHSSKYRYLLKAEATKLCLECHGDGYIHDKELHTAVGDCLQCHNPHLGRDAMMLRDDFRETF